MRHDYLADEKEIRWGRVWVFVLAAALALIALAVLLRYALTGAGWAALPADKYSVENVEKEYEWFYRMHRQIRASRQTLRDLEARKASFASLYGLDSARWPVTAQDEYKQVGQQVLQVQTAINGACGEYEARWDNFFHSMAAPSDIPRQCAALK